jgi:hypothetical protein
MKYLHLILSLPGDPDQALKAAASAAPSLIKLLQRGRDARHEPSLAGTLCHAFGIKQQQDWPLAPICAQAEGIAADDGYWIRLDPVHLEVVMGGLILRPPEALQLSLTEARALIADINLHWHHAGLEIQVVNPTCWLLRLPEIPNLRTTPLDQIAGAYLTPNLPRGADARHYLKLINEVQMLMHSHPVNLAREQAGRPAVNGLWLWGGGTLPACKPRFDIVAAEAFEFQALAQHAGVPLTPPPKTLSALQPGRRALVALTHPESDWDGTIETRLAQLEQDWFQPLLRQLIWGRIHQVRLDLIGQRAVTLTPAQAWRFWR